MRKLPIILTLLSLAFSGVASAVEYVAITPQKRSVKLDPTDIVEIVGHTASNETSYIHTTINFEGWGDLDLREHTAQAPVGQRYENKLTTSSKKGYLITGATSARLKYEEAFFSVTLKITNASELNKVGPTSVLVLPENARGNYDLIVEASADSVTWTPFHSQAVQSVTAKRLFRVRIVHKGQEEAKAKAEEK